MFSGQYGNSYNDSKNLFQSLFPDDSMGSSIKHVRSKGRLGVMARGEGVGGGGGGGGAPPHENHQI